MINKARTVFMELGAYLNKELKKTEENIRGCLTFLRAMLIAFAVIASFFTSSSYASDITAKAAVVINIEDGTMLYGKNPDLKLPPASTTKLITAMVALDRLRPDEEITLSMAEPPQRGKTQCERPPRTCPDTVDKRRSCGAR